LATRIVAACYMLFCLSLSEAFAQELGPINTERPSFSSSPLVLPTGLWQIETGYQFTRDKDESSLKDHTLPNLLLRFGFHEKLELQLSGVTYKWQELDGLEENGFPGAGLGIKWQVNNSDAVVPVGLFGGISLPVGSSEFTNDNYDPSIGIFWSHSSTLDWFGTAIVKYSNDLFTFDNAIGISFSLPGNTGAFVEYLANFYENDNDGSGHNLNLGASWLLSDNLQLDINGGVGLNSKANDYYTGMGISYRFR
jgi:hypothetical protein